MLVAVIHGFVDFLKRIIINSALILKPPERFYKLRLWWAGQAIGCFMDYEKAKNGQLPLGRDPQWPQKPYCQLVCGNFITCKGVWDNTTLMWVLALTSLSSCHVDDAYS